MLESSLLVSLSSQLPFHKMISSDAHGHGCAFGNTLEEVVHPFADIIPILSFRLFFGPLAMTRIAIAHQPFILLPKYSASKKQCHKPIKVNVTGQLNLYFIN